jgi:hypothetical protein
MREKNVENLDELLARFMDAGQAKDAAEDIRAGDRVFAENPAPPPEPALIAKINTAISTTLQINRSIAFRRRIYKMTAVAAAFIIFASLSVRIFEPPAIHQGGAAYAAIIPAAVWEGDDIIADDAELATISAAMDQIEGEMLAVQDGEGGFEGYDELLDLESELIDIESDFWKG